jgi:hypothetical protein
VTFLLFQHLSAYDEKLVGLHDFVEHAQQMFLWWKGRACSLESVDAEILYRCGGSYDSLFLRYSLDRFTDAAVEVFSGRDADSGPALDGMRHSVKLTFTYVSVV